MASEAEIVKQLVEHYTSVGQVIVFPIATMLSMFLVYGIYIIIFGQSINVLWGRGAESSGSKTYMRWIIALFVLATITNALTVWHYMNEALIIFNAVKTNDYIPFFEYTTGPSSLFVSAIQQGLHLSFSTITGCIFDYLMVHRCYIIWGHNKWILYSFGFVIVVTETIGLVVNAVSIMAYQHQHMALIQRCDSIAWTSGIISTTYNSLLTLLTAGRIWWIVHNVGQINESRIHTKYRIIIATILESGLLFTATAVVGNVLPLVLKSRKDGHIFLDVGVISAQMMGIAPTIMIVRIKAGKAVESVHQTVSTLRFAEGANNSQQQSTAAHGMVNPQQSLMAIEERGTVERIEMDQDKPLSNVAKAAA
ncbi:hypothetical protein PQX77_014393 [Marasmius sp. AFHP31]|nr:hypothetical protein PQX77_014393 [Marasmius sp. AFHP31]